MLIAEDGQKLGMYTKIRALQIAKQKKLDLVQVSTGTPIVCKIMDFGKVKYQQAKSAKKKNKISQNQSITKQIQVKYVTQKHDLDLKHKHVKEFLEKGYKVKYTMKLQDAPRQESMIIDRFKTNLKQFTDFATWDNPSKGVYKTISVTMSPLRK